MRRPRDPDATREAVLDAAEKLFAEQGYEPTSMQQIALHAGYARATPAYFFDSKQGLYHAVLTRVVDRAAAAMAEALSDVGTIADPRQVIAPLVTAFVDFLATDPAYVRLIQREGLRNHPFVAHLVPIDAIRHSLATLEAVHGTADASRLLVEMVALCWFPFAHAHTLLAALDIDPHSPEFLHSHTQRVTALLLTGRRPAP